MTHNNEVYLSVDDAILLLESMGYRTSTLIPKYQPAGWRHITREDINIPVVSRLIKTKSRTINGAPEYLLERKSLIVWVRNAFIRGRVKLPSGAGESIIVGVNEVDEVNEMENAEREESVAKKENAKKEEKPPCLRVRPKAKLTIAECPEKWVHGLAVTYNNYGCRCEKCKAWRKDAAAGARLKKGMKPKTKAPSSPKSGMKVTDENRSLGSEFLMLRLRARLTQADVVKLAKLIDPPRSQSYVSAFEKGKRGTLSDAEVERMFAAVRGAPYEKILNDPSQGITIAVNQPTMPEKVNDPRLFEPAIILYNPEDFKEFRTVETCLENIHQSDRLGKTMTGLAQHSISWAPEFV